MKRTTGLMTMLILSAAVALAVVPRAQSSKADVALRAAIETETVKGDVKAAIEMYKKLADGSDRAVAAQALVRLGQCYEKLGSAQTQEARRAYERVVRDFVDQEEAVAEARRYLSSATAQLGSGMVVRQVLSVPGRSAFDSVSRDGRFVATLEEGVGDSIHLRDLMTGENRRIVEKAAPPVEWLSPQISPDGKSVAFGNFQPGGPSATYIVGTDGGAPRVLISGPGEVCGWSSDGREILAVNNPPGPGPRFQKVQLVRVSIADGSSRIVATGAACGQFSPDGRYVAFRKHGSQPAVMLGIFIVGSGGGPERTLIEDVDADQPMWAHDGSAVLFVRHRENQSGLWMIRVKDGEPQGPAVLLNDRLGAFFPLGIARDGSYFYRRYRPVGQWYTVGIDGATGKVSGSPAEAGDIPKACGFDWTRDGRTIAYAARLLRDAESEDRPCSALIVRTVSDGRERMVSHELTELVRPRWSPDGKSILVSGHKDQASGVFRIDPISGATTLLVSTQYSPMMSDGQLTEWSQNGKGIYVARSDLGELVNGRVSSWRDKIMYRDVATGQETERFGVDAPATIISGRTFVSPEGSLGVFVREADGVDSIVVVPAGGAARKILTAKAPNRPMSAAWAADEKGIWICQPRPTADRPEARQLMWLPASGGDPVYAGLTMDGMGPIQRSPDGSRLLFSVFGTISELWTLQNYMLK